MRIRITNLHLIMSFLMLSGFGLFVYKVSSRLPASAPMLPAPAFSAPAAQVPAAPPPAPPSPVRAPENPLRPVPPEPVSQPLERERPRRTGPARWETPQGPSPVARVPAERAAPGSPYTVRHGDTLWGIARRSFGRGSAWVAVWRANESHVPDFDVLEPGQRLILPARPSR